jgi:hypothetical protein
MAKTTFSTTKKPLYIEEWRKAIRKEYPYIEGFKEKFGIEEKAFDYGRQMGLMVAAWFVTESVDWVKYPKDWVEAVKARWLPNWLKKFFPVEYTEIDVKALYPRCSLKDPILKATKRRTIKNDPYFKIIDDRLFNLEINMLKIENLIQHKGEAKWQKKFTK